MKRPPYSEQEIAAAWRDAQALWDIAVTLSPPEPFARGKDSHWPGGEPLAFIDMVTRQVVVNLELLVEVGARASLTAVLAHELGHHVRFPHTLGLSARLQLLERRLLPGLQSSLTNLFFDLQVNEVVGRTRAPELAEVYRGFMRRSKGETSALFWYYLAIYEELWGLEPGELAPAAMADAIDAKYPGARTDARMFAQTFWSLPDVFLQFVYFCSRFLRYLPEPGEAQAPSLPMSGDVGQPDLDDWDGALQGTPGADDALREAADRGWIGKTGQPSVGSDVADDPGAAIRRMSGMPGTALAAFQQVLVERQYLRLVEQHLIEIPGVAPPPDPMLPTTLEDWQHGEDARAIDWTASVIARGALAAAAPMRRELEPDPPAPGAAELPAVEIYLDTSGSMPHPGQSLNAMTLAALVLATSAIRRRGKVRAVVYSMGNPLVSPWMYDEELARRFLLQYAGGGTDYPFAVLDRLSKESRDVLRVVVSDGDFIANCSVKGALDRLATGVERSRTFAALLSLWGADWVKRAETVLGPALASPKFRLAVVDNPGDFGAAARRLADALLGPR